MFPRLSKVIMFLQKKLMKCLRDAGRFVDCVLCFVVVKSRLNAYTMITCHAPNFSRRICTSSSQLGTGSDRTGYAR